MPILSAVEAADQVTAAFLIRNSDIFKPVCFGKQIFLLIIKKK
jgi:hypothetical protein